MTPQLAMYIRETFSPGPGLLLSDCPPDTECHAHSYNSCCDQDSDQCYGQGNGQCLVVPHHLRLGREVPSTSSLGAGGGGRAGTLSFSSGWEGRRVRGGMRRGRSLWTHFRCCMKIVEVLILY